MFEDYFEESNKLIKKLIKSKISSTYVDFKKENLPKKRGVYFIYEKQTGNNDEKLVYIGCAYKKDRNIYIRCLQNLSKSDTGGLLEIGL